MPKEVQLQSLKVYVGLAIFRICNTLLIQSQFDPDEYWQNLEPAYCHVFDDCQGLTWEWKRRAADEIATRNSMNGVPSLLAALLQSGMHGSVRSFVSILPTLVFYKFLKTVQWDTAWMVARGPFVLNAVLVAATTDFCVWYMSSSSHRTMVKGRGGQKEKDDTPKTTVTSNNINLCLYCCLSSWFSAYALVRTYSNSLETALVSISMALVSRELLLENRERKQQSFTWRHCLAFFLGGLCVAVRFTCLTIYVSMGTILALQQKTIRATVQYLFGICALFGALGLGVSVIIDHIMFGFWAFPVLGNFHFNVLEGNGALYGEHPFHWYFTAGIPALTGMLFPALVYDLLWGGWDYWKRNLWIIVATCVLAHSTSSHKEFRFLLPLLPLFCLLAGTRLRVIFEGVKLSQIRFSLFMGAVANLVAILYLGLIHQRAPIDANRAVLELALAKSHQTGIASFRIHYLMGCHSAPLLSHLHAPPIKFNTWYLDCSPSCRADPDIDCESDAFAHNPESFVQQAYMPCVGEDEQETCKAANPDPLQEIPDFVLCNAGDLKRIRGVLEDTMGLTKIQQFINGINGLRVGELLTFGSENMLNDDFSKIAFFDGFLEISWDGMVLYQKIN